MKKDDGSFCIVYKPTGLNQSSTNWAMRVLVDKLGQFQRVQEEAGKPNKGINLPLSENPSRERVPQRDGERRMSEGIRFAESDFDGECVLEAVEEVPDKKH